MSGQTVHLLSSNNTLRVDPKSVPIAASGGKARPDTGKISPHKAANARLLNLNEAVEKLNIRSRSVGRALRFHVDLNTGVAVIRVIDRDTGELIRQIPSEKVAATLTTGSDASGIQLLDDLA